MNCLQATTRLCHSSPGHDFFTGFANPRVISSLSLTFCENKNSLFLCRNSSSIGTNNIVPPLPAHNSSMEGAPSGTTEETLQKPDPVVQYIVLRKDLVDTMKWPLGSVISQGCHAAVAAIWIHKDDPVTAEYCGTENLDNMHKVFRSSCLLLLLCYVSDAFVMWNVCKDQGMWVLLSWFFMFSSFYRIDQINATKRSLCCISKPYHEPSTKIRLKTGAPLDQLWLSKSARVLIL